MNIDIEPSWKGKLSAEFQKDYFQNLSSFIKQERSQHVIYPKESEIFKAFECCPFDKIKVVIIGQDPYHGQNQAHGLCFSVNDEIPHPPSLRNIFKDIKNDLGKDIPESGNLQHWGRQGVLLLNATLTVRASTAASHQNQGWEEFTDAVIQKISDEKQGVIFILWGAYAQKKGRIIDSKKHHLLTSPHPSPLSAHRGFFGNQHFSKTNEYLKENGQSQINW